MRRPVQMVVKAESEFKRMAEIPIIPAKICGPIIRLRRQRRTSPRFHERQSVDRRDQPDRVPRLEVMTSPKHLNQSKKRKQPAAEQRFMTEIRQDVQVSSSPSRLTSEAVKPSHDRPGTVFSKERRSSHMPAIFFSLPQPPSSCRASKLAAA